MTRDEKRLLRADLFRHLDGIATAPVAYALHKSGMLSALLEKKSCVLSQLSGEYSGNLGYLNVAFRVLAAQDWCSYDIKNKQVIISINKKK